MAQRYLPYYARIQTIGGMMTGGLALILHEPDKRVLWIVGQLILIDIVTGVLKGTAHGRLSSRVAALGIRKKLAELLLIYLGAVIDWMAGTGHQFMQVCGAGVGWAECVSIVENLVGLGVAIPGPIKRYLDDQGRSGAAENVESIAKANREA